MKHLLTCLLFVLLAAPAMGATPSPLPWKDFDSQWMQVFDSSSVRTVDKGNVKTYILSEGTAATFFLDNGAVRQVRLTYTGESAPVRYLKGIQQTIRTMLGKGPEADKLIDEFKDPNPPTLSKKVEGLCLERALHEGVGWEFDASYSEECPVHTK